VAEKSPRYEFYIYKLEQNYNCVTLFLEYANQGVWTGGLRLGGTDNWFWRRTGEAIEVDDARWEQGQPDELSNEQCVLTLKGGALGWIDTPVDIRDEDFNFFYALCEF
jgi:hypothetical protein